MSRTNPWRSPLFSSRWSRLAPIAASAELNSRADVFGLAQAKVPFVEKRITQRKSRPFAKRTVLMRIRRKTESECLSLREKSGRRNGPTRTMEPLMTRRGEDGWTKFMTLNLATEGFWTSLRMPTSFATSFATDVAQLK